MYVCVRIYLRELYDVRGRGSELIHRLKVV